jgi:hypothetical protein
MEKENPPTPPRSSRSGGCSLGCASLFVIAGPLWPLLHLIGHTYEPDTLMVPALIGGPSFVVAHILAIVALRSKSGDTRRRGKRALQLIWGGVATFILVLTVAIAVQSILKKV